MTRRSFRRGGPLVSRHFRAVGAVDLVTRCFALAQADGELTGRALPLGTSSGSGRRWGRRQGAV
jgi:hypothetical protein